MKVRSYLLQQINSNLLLFIFFFLILTSCDSDSMENGRDKNVIVGEEVIDPSQGDYVEDFEIKRQITIEFSSGDAIISGQQGNITIDKSGSHLTINSSEEGVEYILSGNSDNGSFKAYSDNKFKLTLNGVSLTNPKGSAINIQTSKSTFIVANENTTNNFYDENNYPSSGSEDMKGCIFSEGQLIFSGKGELQVTGKYKHAICSDDYIIFREDCNLTISEAASDGVHANDYILIMGGNLQINVVGEGIECEKGNIAIHNGSLSIHTSGEKGHGLKSAGNTRIYKGNLTISVNGDASKCIKSDADLYITGGVLDFNTSGGIVYESGDVSSAAGIKVNGNLIFSNAALAVKSIGTAGKGISVDGAISIDDAEMYIVTTGKQYSYNRLTSSSKGIKGKGNVTITGGNYIISTNGGNGSEGIESKTTLTINSGNFEVTAYDDCINASKAIVINGGNMYFYSSGGDGVDSNGTLTVTGGVVIASGTSSPEDGFDCDNNTFKITGGILIGTGGSTSTPTSNACTQYSLIYGTTGTANQLLRIESPTGTEILTYKVPRSYSRMTFLFSSPLLEGNTTYTIYSGGSIENAEEFYGYYKGGGYSGGSQLTTFTTSSMVTQIGSSTGGMGGGGGFPGRR